MKLHFLLLSFAILTTAHAQVAGVVVDQNGKPVAGVVAFFNNTTVQSITDITGNFELAGMPPGFAELVLSKPGYEMNYSRISVRGNVRSQIRLLINKETSKKVPKTSENDKTVLTQIIKKKLADKNIKVYLDGVTINWKDSTISSRAPLVLVNEELGLGRNIVISTPVHVSKVLGNPSFFVFEQSTGLATSIAHAEATRRYFNGTLRAWLLSRLDTSNHNEYSRSRGYSRVELREPVDVNYQNQKSTIIPRGVVEINSRGVLLDTKSIEVSGAMSVTGVFAPLPDDYDQPAVDIDEFYVESFKRFYEKIYVQTDQPYYYSGETIWFKSFVNYYYKPWKDSLSRVMYVELINSKSEVINELSLEILDGSAVGNFNLPDTLDHGQYFIRAYTNLQRNFGEDKLFIKEIPVLGVYDKPVSSGEIKPRRDNPLRLLITTDKQHYSRRDKVSVNIKVVNAEGNPVAADVALSAYDDKLASFINTPSIVDALAFDPGDIPHIEEISYPTEMGLEMNGRFSTVKGKAIKEQLTITQFSSENFFNAESDDDGRFAVKNLLFFDTTSFAIRSRKPLLIDSKAELLRRDRPKVFLPPTTPVITKETQSLQRRLSSYEKPDSVIVLKEITITGKRMLTPEQKLEYRQKHPWGVPDFEFQAKDLDLLKPSVLLALQGKVPGLMVGHDLMGNPIIYYMRALRGARSNASPPQVLIMIDNVPVVGRDAGDVLSSMSMAIVESIDVNTRLVSVIEGGGLGVVNVHTKKGPLTDEEKAATDHVTPLKMMGLAKEQPYRSPNYSKIKREELDARSSLFWDPHVKTDGSASGTNVSFYMSDMVGSYRIIVEGLTADGKPIEGNLLIQCIEQ
jgi:hypothetical protein